MAASMSLLLHFFLLLPILVSSELSDSDALQLLKKSFTNATALSSWTNTVPCDPKAPWKGIICDRDVIVGLTLTGLNLGGTIDADALTHFQDLRILRAGSNSFSGQIPNFDLVPALKAIHLSDNKFSGTIPDDLFGRMTRLKKLWLDGNEFTGSIPNSLSKTTNLLELHLEDNQFTGPIPAFILPSLTSFNVSNNQLEGEIPPVFYKFDAGSFLGNQNLCGKQLSISCGSSKSKSRLVVVCVLILAVVFLAMFWNSRSKTSSSRGFNTLQRDDSSEIEYGARRTHDHSSSHAKTDHEKLEEHAAHRRNVSSSNAGHKRIGSSMSEGGGKAGGGVDLIMVNEMKGVFGMQDLMKAAAEVMGNGSLGSAYKAVMGNGVAVVVKRMRDMNRVGKEGFNAEMKRLGALKHPNVLPPLAYHYRKDEKLLIFEFIPKGSLLYVLHGDRGPDHAALDWPIRLKIALGVARGLVYLQEEQTFVDVPHGNLKSGNVLLAPDYEPLLVDYGFEPLVNTAQAANVMQAFKAPEYLTTGEASPKCDVYSFGILLLEILTGKFPTQYLGNAKGGTDVIGWATAAVAEGREAEILDPAIVGGPKASISEMKKMVGIALDCLKVDPDKRLSLKEVAVRIEEVATAAAERVKDQKGTGGHVGYVKDSEFSSSSERSRRSSGSGGDASSFGIS